MDVSSDKTDVMDVAALASAAQLVCTAVLHGHTHRPSDRLLTDGLRKVVLGDWDETQAKPAQCARYSAGHLSTFLF